MGEGVAVIADGARARAQPRQRTIPTASTATSTTSPASPSPRRCSCWSRESQGAALLPRARSRARDLGRLPLRPGGGASERFGFDEAHPIDELDEMLPKLLENQPALYYPVGAEAEWDARVMRWLNAVRAQGARRRRRARARAGRARAARRHAPGQGRARARASCAAPPRIAAGGAPARDAVGAARDAASTRSRPSCCTSSAATARSSRPTRRSSPAAPNACVLHYVANDARAARRRPAADRRRLRARRLRLRHHAHLSGQRPLQRPRSARSTRSCSRRSARRSPR